jgi:dienelactone hydrolase
LPAHTRQGDEEMIRWVVSLLAVLGLAFAVGPSVGPRDEVMYTDAGLHASGWRDIQIAREEGSTFAARIYFPANQAGVDAPIATATSPFPVIAFGHGYMQPVESYAALLRHLASNGFVVIAPRSFESSPFPSHSQFGSDLNKSLNALIALAGDPASPFHQRVDLYHLGAMGHSMGGGAALLAAANESRISAVSVWAMVDTNPSAVLAMARDTRPMQWIAGAQDGIVPADQRELWRQVNSPAPLQVPLIAGGAHCGFQNYSAFALFCDRGDLPKAEQVRVTQQLLTDWFSLYLRNDLSRWASVWSPPTQSSPQVSVITRNAYAPFPASNASQ